METLSPVAPLTHSTPMFHGVGLLSVNDMDFACLELAIKTLSLQLTKQNASFFTAGIKHYQINNLKSWLKTRRYLTQLPVLSFEDAECLVLGLESLDDESMHNIAKDQISFDYDLACMYLDDEHYAYSLADLDYHDKLQAKLASYRLIAARRANLLPQLRAILAEGINARLKLTT